MTDGPRHWSDLVANLLSSRTGNLRELAEMANCDWRTLYRGQSLAGCHLEGQDLRGMDLSGCDIELAKIDDKTLLDLQFDPRKDELDRYRTFLSLQRWTSTSASLQARNHTSISHGLIRTFLNDFITERFIPILKVCSKRC